MNTGNSEHVLFSCINACLSKDGDKAHAILNRLMLT